MTIKSLMYFVGRFLLHKSGYPFEVIWRNSPDETYIKVVIFSYHAHYWNQFINQIRLTDISNADYFNNQLAYKCFCKECRKGKK